MLLEFTVKNFLSIKDEVTLSMVASKDSSLEDNTIKYENNKKNGKRALRSAVIYGANASGKSNILKAIKFMSWFINTSHEMQQGRRIPRLPFKLDRACINEPSDFQIIFMYKDVKYLYGFSVNELEVVEEYLYHYPNGRQSIIFERENVDEYKFTKDVERQTEIKDKFHSKNKLFLSTESLWEYENAKIPFEWLSKKLQVFIEHDNLEIYTAGAIAENEVMRELVKKYIRVADLGIEDINVEIKKKEEILSLEVFNTLPDDKKNDIIKTIGDRNFLDIKIIHSEINENGESFNVEFDLNEESEGTQKFFGILGPWIEALINGKTLIVDELDIRLHTLLVKALVQMFLNPEINKNNAQLIFSTHDTNLLDQDIFRRDQVWFAEKKKDKSTDLYSLYDFGGVRKNNSIEKGYLQGKYGAIPFFKGEWIWD